MYAAEKKGVKRSSGQSSQCVVCSLLDEWMDAWVCFALRTNPILHAAHSQQAVRPLLNSSPPPYSGSR